MASFLANTNFFSQSAIKMASFLANTNFFSSQV